MKIAIIGYAGSGKSTLARQLGEFYDIPVLHMDKTQFEHNWIERDEEIAKNTNIAINLQNRIKNIH